MNANVYTAVQTWVFLFIYVITFQKSALSIAYVSSIVLAQFSNVPWKLLMSLNYLMIFIQSRKVIVSIVQCNMIDILASLSLLLQTQLVYVCVALFCRRKYLISTHKTSYWNLRCSGNVAIWKFPPKYIS